MSETADGRDVAGDTDTGGDGALLRTSLGSLPLLAGGMVRDIYALGGFHPGDSQRGDSRAGDGLAGDGLAGGELLFVATDRISAFDHVLGSGISGKGRILTALSRFWFRLLAGVVANHVVADDARGIAERLAPHAQAIYERPMGVEEMLAEPEFARQIAGRAMVVRRARMYPVECVARGYLSGSGWQEYRATGAVCGIALPAGLTQSARLAQPLFTPAAKIHAGGHDENISYEQAEEEVGAETAAELRRLTLALYERASAYAGGRGLILADTKFEFGWVEGQGIVLADEVLTPDSSRYWPAEGYAPGGPQPSFDKQYVRDYLERVGWNKQAPAPALPREVTEATRRKYVEAYELLTGDAEQFAGS